MEKAMSNGSGSYSVTSENQMKAYDRLPASARAALQDAAFDWAVPPIVTYWRNGRKGFQTGREIAARVAEWDKKKHDKNVKRGLVCP